MRLLPGEGDVDERGHQQQRQAAQRSALGLGSRALWLAAAARQPGGRLVPTAAARWGVVEQGLGAACVWRLVVAAAVLHCTTKTTTTVEVSHEGGPASSCQRRSLAGWLASDAREESRRGGPFVLSLSASCEEAAGAVGAGLVV